MRTAISSLSTLAPVLLVAGALAIGGPAPASAPEAAGATTESPPNVVVIMTDDQRLETVDVMRSVERELAAGGTTFEHAYATYPLCCPSRATFLTGQYAHNHGVLDNRAPDGGYSAFDDSGTLPVSLSRAGYRTAYMGKYLNGYSPKTRRELRDIPPGWDHWFTTINNSYFGGRFNANGRLRRFGDDTYQTDLLAERGADFIARSARADDPFFLTLAMKAPHVEEGRNGEQEAQPAPRHRGRFRGAPLPRSPAFNERDISDKPSFIPTRRFSRERRNQLAGKYRGQLESVLAVDDAVARIVRQLRAVGELDDTLVVFTSDNGLLLGEHRLDGKTHLYEESARVPLIMRGPGFPAGEIREQIVGNIDLPATILELAGADPDRVLDGHSLVPLAQDPEVDREGDILLENRRSAALRTARYMYAEHRGGARELYDMAADPFQLESRHDDPQLADVQERLAARLVQLRDCAGAACR